MFRRNFIATLAGAGLLVTALSAGSTAATAAPTSPAPSGAAASTTTDLLSMGVLAKSTPLKDGKALVRPTPPAGGDAYRYSTTSNYWSVVATIPDDYYFDVDLRVYGDPAHKELIGQSVGGAGSDDFVAMDSNHLPLDFYYPGVEKAKYHGEYRVEQVQGSKVVLNGFQNVPLLGSNFVTVYDAVLEAGKSYRFVLSPNDESMNGSMYLMASDPTDKSSWVQTKDDFIRYVDPPSGSGGYFDITPNRTDRYGLVIVSTGDPGTFGLTQVIY